MKMNKSGLPLGKVVSIAVRPIKKAVPQPLVEAKLNTKNGLEGDHYSGQSGKRQLTLISEQEIIETARLLNKDKIDPVLTRRNLLYSGVPISENENRHIAIGDDLLIQITGPCHPCKQMDENFGPGAENAMKGRAGLTARVINEGKIKVGDKLFFVDK
jgi:MOSC domain-containing protein YiiM